MNQVLECDASTRLTPPQKFVLLLLANNANDEGMAYPSITRLARYSNLGERTVQRAITALADAGCLTIRARPGRSSVYLIHPERGDTPVRVRGSMKPPHQTAQEMRSRMTGRGTSMNRDLRWTPRSVRRVLRRTWGKEVRPQQPPSL
jgi:DNA-binding transcriptional MocR family regulator